MLNELGWFLECDFELCSGAVWALFGFDVGHDFLVNFIGDCAQEFVETLNALACFFGCILREENATASSAGGFEKVKDDFGEFDVDDWDCEFDVSEVAWAADGGVAAGFAALAWLKGA